MQTPGGEQFSPMEYDAQMVRRALGVVALVALCVAGCEEKQPPPETQTMFPAGLSPKGGVGAPTAAKIPAPPNGPLPIPYPNTAPASKVSDQSKPTSGSNTSGSTAPPASEDPSAANAAKVDGG